MKKDGPFVEFVLRSQARTEVLLAVAEGCNTTQSLLDHDLASTSAVYNALNELQEHELIHKSRAEQWRRTGTGAVVSNLIRQQQKAESVLAAAPDYWRTHDATVLPLKFRTRLSELAGGDVVRATETRPDKAICDVKQRLTKADSVDAIAPVYNERLTDAAWNADTTRLVCNKDVLKALIEETPLEDHNGSGVMRVTDVSFAVTVTDDYLLLSLPDLDGNYDPQTEFVADSDAARQWGHDLLDHYWMMAEPADQYLATSM